MNPGELKHRIALLEYITTENENGFKEKRWQETNKTWAKITRNVRSKTHENDRKTEEASIFFVVRYQAIDVNKRIAYQGKQYEIVQVEDETFEKRFLTIHANEVNT